MKLQLYFSETLAEGGFLINLSDQFLNEHWKLLHFAVISR